MVLRRSRVNKVTAEGGRAVTVVVRRESALARRDLEMGGLRDRCWLRVVWEGI